MTLTPAPSAPLPPWQQRQLPYALKFVVTFFTVLLGFIAFMFTIVWLMMVPQMVIQGPGLHDTIGEMVTIGLILTGGIIVFGAATLALLPWASAPTRFTPSYGTVPPAITNHPFEVRYQRSGWGRTMSDKGTVCFDTGGLAVTGYITPSPLLQLLIVIVFTLVPLLMFGVGLGFLPALIIAHYLGRKQLVTRLPYQDLGDVVVQGCRATVKGPGTPKKISFIVASVDGERLYRELLPRFPGALGGWLG